MQVCEEIVQPGQPMPELYDMLLRALAYLAYDAQTPCENIVLPFLTRAMVLSGHGVMLTRCAVCGGRIRDARFDPLGGRRHLRRARLRPPARHHRRGHGAAARLRHRRICACPRGLRPPLRLSSAASRGQQLEREFEALTFAEKLSVFKD